MRQARQRPTICTYGDGRQVRDWLYVEDHGVAIDRILGADVSGCTFNGSYRGWIERQYGA